MVMTRYVPKDEFGSYVLILVIVNCLTVLGGLGLDLTLVKFISEEPAIRKKAIIPTIVITRIAFLLLEALLIYTLGYMLLQFFDQSLAKFLVYIPMLFFVASFRDLFYNLLQGLQVFKKYALVQIVSAVLRFSLILSIVFFGQLTLARLVYIELGTILLTVLVQIVCIPFKAVDTFRPSLDTLRSLIKFGFPLYLNNILTFLYDRINIVLIGAFMSPVNIAYFEVAGKIPEGCARMFRSFIVVFFPNLSGLFSKGEKQDAESIMNTSLTAFASVFFFLVLGSFLFGKEIIGMIFSEKYATVAFAFALLMLNFSMRAVSNIMGYSLVSAGYSNIPVKVNSVSSAINIIGALIMIPAYGYIGAVYAVLIMNIISQVMHGLYLMKAQISLRYMEYLKPLCILIPLVGIYLLVGIESYSIRLLMLVAYMCTSWVLIKDLRKIMNSFLPYGKKFKSKQGLQDVVP
jgi:O-antigen/teichoic acid export membrane protein